MSLLYSRGYEVRTDNSVVPPVTDIELPLPVSSDQAVGTDVNVRPSSSDTVSQVGDGGVRAEIPDAMIQDLMVQFPDVIPEAWNLLRQMSPAEAFQLILALTFQRHLTQTPVDTTDTPEPEPEPEPEPIVPDPRVMGVEQVRVLLNDELAAEYGALATNGERVAFLVEHGLEVSPIRHPNRDEIVVLHEDVVRKIFGDDLADQYVAMDDENKIQFLIDHSVYIPEDEDEEGDTLLDPRTRELMRDLGSEVVAEKILIEHMARASKKFADAIDPEFEKANDKWLLKSLRWLFNISPEENIKTVGLQTLVDGLIFVGSTGLDYVTGKPLMDQLEKIGFLSALGIDRSRADGKADHDTLEYKSHIKLRILGQVIDFVTDAMMEGGINKVYEMLNRKEMKEMFVQLGYSEDEVNKYMETWKNGSYVTPLAGVLGKLSTIFLPADIKNLVSSANLSAGQRILRRFPVVGRYVFSPIVDFIDGRFKKWPILKGLIPTVGGVVGLARELR